MFALTFLSRIRQCTYSIFWSMFLQTLKFLFTNSKGLGSWLMNVVPTLHRREREKNNTRGRAIEIKKEEGGRGVNYGRGPKNEREGE